MLFAVLNFLLWSLELKYIWEGKTRMSEIIRETFSGKISDLKSSGFQKDTGIGKYEYRLEWQTLLRSKSLCWKLKALSKRLMGMVLGFSFFSAEKHYFMRKLESWSFFEDIRHTEEDWENIYWVLTSTGHTARWLHTHFLVSVVLLNSSITGIFHLQDGGWEQWGM